MARSNVCLASAVSPSAAKHCATMPECTTVCAKENGNRSREILAAVIASACFDSAACARGSGLFTKLFHDAPKYKSYARCRSDAGSRTQPYVPGAGSHAANAAVSNDSGAARRQYSPCLSMNESVSTPD